MLGKRHPWRTGTAKCPAKEKVATPIKWTARESGIPTDTENIKCFTRDLSRGGDFSVEVQ